MIYYQIQIGRFLLKVLDSDHCIALMHGDIILQEWVQQDEIIAITAISVGEIVHGAYKSYNSEENIARVRLLLPVLTILPFNERAAWKFGWLKAYLEKKGMKLDTADLQIAAIVLARNLILVTHNQKHFQRVPNLKLEDWRV